MKTATVKVRITGMCMLPGEVLLRVYIARAAVNKIVGEDSKLTTCSLQVQQFLLSFRP